MANAISIAGVSVLHTLSAVHNNPRNVTSTYWLFLSTSVSGSVFGGPVTATGGLKVDLFVDRQK